MRWILIAVGIAVLLGIVFFLGKRRSSTEFKITLNGIRSVYDALQASGNDGSFAVFIPPGSSENVVNIQFSIEHGSIGLDWVLASPVNVRDKDRFVELLDREKARYSERSLNGVDFLRSTDSRAPDLCKTVLKEMYAVPDDVGILLITSGFEWGAR